MTCGLLYLPEHNAYMRLYIMYHLHLISKCKITSLSENCYVMFFDGPMKIVAHSLCNMLLYLDILKKACPFGFAAYKIQQEKSVGNYKQY